MNSALPICPVCKNEHTALWSEAKDYEYFSTAKTYYYYHCPRCGTIFIDPLPLDELHAIYPSNYYSFSDTKKNWAVRLKERLDKKLLRKILAQIPGDTINVLDIGGGTGWLLDLVKKTEPRVHLTQVVDIDTQAGAVAAKKGHRYFNGRIEDFKSNETFHLILMLNLVEHISAPGVVLQTIEHNLSPEGIILIKTPNTDSLDARLFRKTYWGGLHCPRHWIIFSEKSFRLLLQNTGLVIHKRSYTQGGVFWAFSIIIRLANKKILRTGPQRPVIFHPLFPLLSACFAAFDFLRRPFSKTSQLFIQLKKRSSR